MCKNEEQRRVKKGRVFFIEFQLFSQIIPGVIEGIDLIDPERLLVIVIKS
jgi:hypothetical protein